MSTCEICFADVRKEIDAKGRMVSMEVPYIVSGVADETDALTALEAPPIAGLLFDKKRIDARLSSDTWRVVAAYKNDPDSQTGGGSDEHNDKDDLIISYEITGGGTQHITNSLETVSRMPATAPDYQGAINFDGETVNGLDVASTTLTFSIQVIVPLKKFNRNDVPKWARMTNKTNSDAFYGFDAGELLFQGVSVDQRGIEDDSKVTLKFTFAYSENRSDIPVGKGETAVSVTKKGWEYLWVKHKPGINATGKYLQTEIEGAYIERIYDEVSFDFGDLI